MNIESFYKDVCINNYFLGKISQIYRDNCVLQVENLSVLSCRNILNESLIPNTINCLVIIDSVQGIFLGEVFQSKILSNEKNHSSLYKGIDETIYPEISIDLIGVFNQSTSRFKLPEFMNVGMLDKVYFANKNILHLYLDSIEVNNNSDETPLIFGDFLNYENEQVKLRPSTLFDHHLLVVGTTNSGKSTSSLSILNQLDIQNKKMLIIDPSGEYEDAFQDQNGRIKKVKLGINAAISPSKITMRQWAILFQTNENTQGAVLSDAIKSLQYQKKNHLDGCYIKENKMIISVKNNMSTLTNADMDFDISLLPKQIEEESVAESKDKKGTYIHDIFRSNANNYLFDKVSFALSRTKLKDFFTINENNKDLITIFDTFLNEEHSSLYIDTSNLGTSDEVGGMIIDLLCNHLLSAQSVKPFVLFIDEVHRYTHLFGSNENFFNGLINLAREGRKKGIFLFLTTQNPQDVSPILLGQIGTLLIHRLTHFEEIKAIQNHVDEYSLKSIKKLNQGEAILASINLLSDIYIRINKCNRIQHNQTPKL